MHNSEKGKKLASKLNFLLEGKIEFSKYWKRKLAGITGSKELNKVQNIIERKPSKNKRKKKKKKQIPKSEETKLNGTEEPHVYNNLILYKEISTVKRNKEGDEFIGEYKESEEDVKEETHLKKIYKKYKNIDNVRYLEIV